MGCLSGSCRGRESWAVLASAWIAAVAGPKRKNLIEPHAHLVGSVPSRDSTIKLQDLRFQYPQLCPKRRETATRKFRYPLVTGIGDHIKQLLDTLASYEPDPQTTPIAFLPLQFALISSRVHWLI